MRALLLLFFIISAFSLLTIYEIILLRKAGFDVIAHLRFTQGTGKKLKFFFEAFGVVAFVLFQPIALTCLLVWATNNINPELAKNLYNMITPDSAKNLFKNF